MNDNVVRNEPAEVEFQGVLSALLKKAWFIALMSILGLLVALLITRFLVTPQYQSEAMFYVNNSSISVGDASLSISSGDITASKDLVDTYIVILNTRETLNDVIDYAGVDRTCEELENMIEASSVNGTEVFQVVVTSPDPEEAVRIADSIAYILPKRITKIVEGTSAQIVDSAVVASNPSSPSYVNNLLVGFLLGLVLSVGIVILRKLFDITVREEEDIAQCCDYPILASVPDMAAPSKGGYYYGSGEKKAGKKFGGSAAAPALVGSDISFSASEAYKLLRTKIQFSFADANGCRVIGVSSALSGEGKSLTAANLAYTLSQLNKRVLLIDGDMRRPTVAEKLGVENQHGLSSYLTGQVDINKLIQQCNIKGDGNVFHVISAGESPPNPVELLGSARMKKMLDILREHYSYIVLDLPPVGEVSDALVAAKQLDGMVLVVRQNHCNTAALTSAVRQFRFVDAKILGVVYNCATDNSGIYGKKYYKKYYSK